MKSDCKKAWEPRMTFIGATSSAYVLSIFLSLFISYSALAQNAQTAYDTMKSLQGTWSIHSTGKGLPIVMTYNTESKESVVTEQFGKELSVFYRDGRDLLMTHFCNIGNQPRLRLKSGSNPNIFKFEMFDITNLSDPNAAHVQRIVYEFINDRRLHLTIIWKRGPRESVEDYTLDRG